MEFPTKILKNRNSDYELTHFRLTKSKGKLNQSPKETVLTGLYQLTGFRFNPSLHKVNRNYH